MAEIEYFVDPQEKSKFYKFDAVKDLKVTLFSGCRQLDGKGPEVKSLGDAVADVSCIAALGVSVSCCIHSVIL